MLLSFLSPASWSFEEDFESGTLTSFTGSPSDAAYASSALSDAISGNASLVIANPDYTKQAYYQASSKSAWLTLIPGRSYLIQFDWKILETIDGWLQSGVSGGGSAIAAYTCNSAVTGDAGTARYSVTIPSAPGVYSLNFTIASGGGKAAIDNVRVLEGGAGPWRRDFTNGFVLINPFAQPWTFPVSDVAGAVNRTGVHHILGTQAPEINDGSAVNGNFLLGGFDSIILLADPINTLPSFTSGAVNSKARFGPAQRKQSQ